MEYLANIKRLRLMHKMTQAELAEGICSQTLVSKIEQQLVSPEIGIMMGFAKKFGITLSQLVGEVPSDNVSDTIYNEIIRLNRERKYDRLYSYLQEILFESRSYPVEFKNWVYAIVKIEVMGDMEGALELLHQAYREVNRRNYNNLFLILLSLGSIYTELSKFEKALTYYVEAYELQSEKIIDKSMRRKLLYNIGRCYIKMDQPLKTILYANIALQEAFGEDSIMFLDEIHLLLANAYIKLDDFYQAYDHSCKAKHLAEIRNNNHILPFIEKTQEEIQEVIKKNNSYHTY